MKTSELTDAALDLMVAKAEGKFITRDPMGFGAGSANGGYWIWDENMQIGNHYSPSSLWSQGGPIMEREEIGTYTQYPRTGTKVWYGKHQGSIKGTGPNALVAAMRCYVASKLGDEVEVPDELL